MKSLKIKIIAMTASIILLLGLFYSPLFTSNNLAQAQVEAEEKAYPNSEDYCRPPATNCMGPIYVCFDKETGDRVPCEN